MADTKFEPPPLMVKARDIKVVGDYVKSLPQDQQEIFRERWNKIEDPKKREEVIQKTILAYGQREKSRQQEQSIGQAGIMGGIPGMAGNYGMKSGVPISDLPHIAAKTGSGLLYGVPEAVANNPIAGGVEQGAKMMGAVPDRSVFPPATTPQGEKMGNVMSILSGLASVSPPASKVASETAQGTSNRLMNSVLKPTLKDLQKNPELGFEAAKAGFTGTRNQIFEKAEKLLLRNENKLQGILDKSKGTVDASKVADVIGQVKKPFANTGDDSAVTAIEELQKFIRDKGTLTAKEANILKRDFYTTLKESNYGASELPAKTLAKKAAARGLREGIELAEPKQPIAELNKQMGLAGKIRDLAEKSQNTTQKSNIGNIVDLGLTGGGIGTGNPAFYAAIAARKALGSSFVKSKLAELLSKLA